MAMLITACSFVHSRSSSRSPATNTTAVRGGIVNAPVADRRRAPDRDAVTTVAQQGRYLGGHPLRISRAQLVDPIEKQETAAGQGPPVAVRDPECSEGIEVVPVVLQWHENRQQLRRIRPPCSSRVHWGCRRPRQQALSFGSPPPRMSRGFQAATRSGTRADRRTPKAH
jgi:hypothetical protein